MKHIYTENKSHMFELSDSVTIDYERENPLIGKMEGAIFARI